MTDKPAEGKMGIGRCFSNLAAAKILNKPATRIFPRASFAASVILVVIFYLVAQAPQISEPNRLNLAKEFHFIRKTLPEKQGVQKKIRQVNPQLKRIAAWISAIGAAVSLGDLDGNGLPDDYVLIDPRTDLITVGPVPETNNRYPLFAINPQPLPYDTTKMAPVGALISDLNEDGLSDILVYYWGRTPIAFLRKQESSDGTIPNASSYIPCEISPSLEDWYTGSASIADLDGDGHADLVFGNYFADGSKILDPSATNKVVLQDSNSRAFNGGRKHIFLWKKASENSVEYSKAQGVFDSKISQGWNLAQGCQDINGDLLPEIYFAHDVGPDRLLLNQSKPGQPLFSLLEGKENSVTPSSFVLGQDSFKGMGVDFGDINNDGKPDIYVSNIACSFGLDECHFLWLNNGNINGIKYGIAPYQQKSELFGLSHGGWGWDCRLADFNNDGIVEAIQAKGFIKGKINRWPETQALGTSNAQMLSNPHNWPAFRLGDDVSGHDANSFFVRAEDQRYYDLAEQLGLADRTLSRGIAIADVNGDGLLDFALANQWGDSYFIYNRSPVHNRFLGLRLLLPIQTDSPNKTIALPGCNKLDIACSPAIGAEATVHLNNGTLRAQVDGGSGHSGKRSPELHFGLGNYPNMDKIKIDLRWRDRKGKIQLATVDLEPGWHTIVLGKSAREEDRQ